MQIYKNMVILASAGNLTPYVHPTTHSPSIIQQDSLNRFVTDAEKTAWNSGTGGTSYTHPTTHAPSIIQQDASNRFVTDVQISAWNSGTGGTSYTHPVTHAPSIIQQDASNRFVTDTEKTTWNNKGDPYTHPTTHSPSIIQQDTSNRFVTDAEKTAWNSGLSTIGGSQTWQSVTGSRSKNVVYTNTTGKPICISVQVFGGQPPATTAATIYINGLSVVSDYSFPTEPGNNGVVDLFCIVPASATYQVTTTDTLSGWIELR